jgi:tRNA threonylcarbamoyladenosine biosynthesis protein TsaB
VTLLAIDTSGTYASVAIFDGERVLAEETWRAKRHQDDELFPAIEHALALAGVGLASLTRVAVAGGPGSFTGLRVGIAAAQGIGRASGAALIAVPTLDAVAHPFRSGRIRVCPLVPAGRGEHYCALYGRTADGWGRRSELATLDAEGLARATAGLDTLFAGEIDPETRAALRARLGDRAAFPASSMRRAGDLAALAWQRAEAGQAVSPAELEPLYVRPAAVRGPAGELVEEPAAPAGKHR